MIAVHLDELSLPVTMADFEQALKKVQSSVSKEDIAKYENWMKSFGTIAYYVICVAASKYSHLGMYFCRKCLISEVGRWR